MKFVTEYVFAGLFFLTSGLCFALGHYGSAFLAAAFGAYWPLRDMANELFNAIDSWKINKKQKFLWGVCAALLVLFPIKLMFLDITSFALGLLMIGLLAHLDIHASKE